MVLYFQDHIDQAPNSFFDIKGQGINICAMYETAIKHIKSHSVDLVLTDLPYGVTNAKWDIPIDFAFMWDNLDRVCKKHTTMVFTGTEPFGSKLIQSNEKDFKYDIIWTHKNVTRVFSAESMPLRQHENVYVFYKDKNIYNPQMSLTGKSYKVTRHPEQFTGVFGAGNRKYKNFNNGERYPTTIIHFTEKAQGRYHNSQKPIKLFEYFIKTFTNEGDIVLDITAGSGTTAVAAINTNRKFIIIEKEEKYAQIAEMRIQEALQATKTKNKNLDDLL